MQTGHTYDNSRELTLSETLKMKSKQCLIDRLLTSYAIIAGLVLVIAIGAAAQFRTSRDLSDLKCYYDAAVYELKRK